MRTRNVATAAATVFAVSLAACASSSTSKTTSAQSGESSARAEVSDRLDDAATLVAEFQGKLPESVAREARCVVVVPSMVRGGFIVGARHGEGFALCRAPGGSSADRWSAPAPISVSGGSAGFQIGLESVDLLMLVETQNGMKKLLRSRFELGADVSASAGPLGRGREVATDTTMKAEVLSYTRSRGLFAGAELGGAVVKQDDDATRALYGAGSPDFRALLAGDAPATAGAGQHFVEAVRNSIR